jgi:HK97 family phage portal protein
MGILSSAIAERKMTSEDIWRQLYGGRKSSTGQTVNRDTALQTSVVFANCRLIGNDMATPPLKLMRRVDRKTVPARDHPLFNLMAKKPNRWQTSFQWRQQMSWHVELAKGHFAYISRLGKTIKEIFPFEPDDVEVISLGRGLFEYKVTAPDGSSQTFPAADILHVHGPTWDGINGLDVVKQAREAIGLALATESSAATLHKNGIQSSGTYSVEGKLDEAQHKLLTKWVEEHYAGDKNAGKPMVMDRAAKWVSNQMTGIDAQALETRNHQIEEVCRFMGVIPLMIGYSGDKASTYASAEQMFLAHERNCLAPRWTDYEQVFDTRLLTEKEREEGYYFKFSEGGRLRGSIKDKKDVILGYVNGGVMTPNEGRDLLDMNPMDDEASDKLRIPANITGAAPAPTPQE